MQSYRSTEEHTLRNPQGFIKLNLTFLTIIKFELAKISFNVYGEVMHTFEILLGCVYEK